MKIFLLLILMSAPLLAGAVQPPSSRKLPDSIKCITEDKAAGKVLKISRLNTDEPVWDKDGNLMGIVKDSIVFNIGFSNECDNDYEFLFFVDDLVALAEKKIERVNAILRFSNSDLIDLQAKDPAYHTGYRTLHIYCTYP